MEDKTSMCLLFNSDVAEVKSESKQRQRNKIVVIRAENNVKTKKEKLFFLNSLHKIDQGKEIHNIRNEKVIITTHRENIINTFIEINLKMRLIRQLHNIIKCV